MTKPWFRTMDTLTEAMNLLEAGFWLFPIKPMEKTPAHRNWQVEATRDVATVEDWFKDDRFNVGIYTGKFGDDGEALLVVDVDNKEGKNGDAEVLRLELEGREFSPTRIHTTPTGGRHIVYRVSAPIQQGANKLGVGLDIRSRGGYIVGPGSSVPAGRYGSLPDTIELAPAWIAEICGDRAPKRASRSVVAGGIDERRAEARAAVYLEKDAPLGKAGARNDTAYKVATRMKDFGVAEDVCALMMAEKWNCEPPLDNAELQHVVHSAYTYAQEPQGAAAPEAVFDKVEAPATVEGERSTLHPFAELNLNYAWVSAGGGSHILFETTDVQGRWKLEHLNTGTFHEKFAAQKIVVGKKECQVTHEWMAWKKRRSYEGVVFMPQLACPDRFYNLWKGFAYKPFPADKIPHPAAEKALHDFLDHIRVNVCQDTPALYNWLVTYFAQLVQTPWDKPLVALVFKGGKGVGKNVAVETVGKLLGSHFLLTSNRRYLISNFNGHLENCLMFALDEAFWSGDKQAEGVLKDLVTGKQHQIEHKGKEQYSVDNRTRVVIIGNEEWLVPASQDERRYAVFQVGDGRKQDRAFFNGIEKGMEKGGYELLLRFLLAYDIKGADLNEAPNTDALLEQKHSSLEPVYQWWLDCLTEGRIVASDFADGWPDEIDCDRFRTAIRRYAREHNIRSRIPEDRAIGRQLTKGCSEMKHIKVSGNNGYVYKFPPLEKCRKLWCEFIGHDVKWPA